jgi:ABC-type sugar transport system permease subunit
MMSSIISGIVLTTVFQAFIDPDIGAIQEIVKMFNPEFQMPTLMGSPDTATKTIMTYVIWTCVCGNMLLVCGAMNRIPVDVLEAARLDGIGPLREFFNIILPLIWPTLSTLLILTCTGFLNSSGPLLLFGVDSYTMGTTTISYWIFEKVYMNGTLNDTNYNLVSAAGLMLTLVALPIILAIRKLLDFVPSVEY